MKPPVRETTPETCACSKLSSLWKYRLYNLLLTLCFPLLAGYLVWRLVRGKSRAGLWERLGFLPATVREYGRSEDTVIWIQAASVGEVNAVAPILQELRLRLPLARLVLSVTTPTGRSVAEKRDLGVDAVIYFPFDLPLVVERVLKRLNPRLLVMVETELWPNLLHLCQQRGIATAVVNGRISDRAYPKARALRPLYCWMLSNVDLVCAQSEQDAERFRSLGAKPEIVSVAGNSKFDEAFPQLSPAEAARWRQEFGFNPEALVLLAGSTHEGEEEIILSVFDHLRFTHPDLQLIIAPRHPERGDRVHSLVQEHGYDVYRRSHVLSSREAGEDVTTPAGPAVRVVILDTIGELAGLYGCADVVVVGGSFIKGLSGHNILQPIAQEKPTLFGPYMADFRDISAIAVREGCGLQVADEENLTSECDRLLSSAEARRLAAERGREMIAKYGGASARYSQTLERLLGTDETAPEAVPEAGEE